MTVDLAYLRHLRDRHEILFDRCLFSAILEEAGFDRPSLNGDEIWHLCRRRKRIAILRGEEAAFAVLRHWPHVDLALERLTGEPSTIGIETFQDILGLSRRQTHASFKRLVKSYHQQFSREELQLIADRLLDRTGALVFDHLRKTGRTYTIKAGGPYG